MEVLILHRLDWIVMGQPTCIGILYMTGLLQGIPPLCAANLEEAVLCAYRHTQVRLVAPHLHNTHEGG